jgi:2'-5' RNA ligase
VRVFAALPPSQTAMQALELVLAAIEDAFPRLRCVKPAGIHLTMHFFGEIPDQAVKDLIEIFGDPGLRHPVIGASLGQLGCFPERGNPRVVWVGIEQAYDALRAFSKLFQSKIARLGYREDPRGFAPHITLARNRDARVDPEHLREIPVPKLDFAFKELVLFQSVLKQGGAEYAPLTRLALTGLALTEDGQ